jgi:signal transduction histidine kinase
VTCAIEDHNGDLWLGTDKGVARVRGGTDEWFSDVEVIRKENGLISNYVKCMTRDRNDHLWFGTDCGVSKYDGRDFQNILLEDELSLGFVEQIMEDHRGDIYFITTKNGILKYQPARRETLPRIHLTEVHADQLYQAFTDVIQVPTPADLVTFTYKAISFSTRPEHMRYTYRLAGLEDEWQPSTRDTRIHYSHLEPGEYRFLVRAIDRELHYSDPPASVTITVYQPYYRSWLFMVLIVLMAAGGLAGVAYMGIQLRRQRHIAARFREKLAKGREAERIQSAKMSSLRQVIAGVAHEINNPIGAITSSDDVTDRAVGRVKEIIEHDYEKSKQNAQLQKTFSVIDDVAKVKHTAAEKIASIVTSLRRFVRLDEAEWQVADVHDGLDSAIALMRSEFEGKAEIIKQYGEIPNVYCAPGSCNQVFMAVLRNALESLTEPGTITIKTGVSGKFLRIEIRDTGRGIPEEHLPRVFDPGFTTKGVQVGVGLGLAICYDIVSQRHGGRIEIASTPGEGSTVTIQIPTSPPESTDPQENNHA